MSCQRWRTTVWLMWPSESANRGIDANKIPGEEEKSLCGAAFPCLRASNPATFVPRHWHEVRERRRQPSRQMSRFLPFDRRRSEVSKMANVAPVRKSAVVATDPVDADEARTVSSEFGKAPGAEADPLLSFESERKVAQPPTAPNTRH